MAFILSVVIVKNAVRWHRRFRWKACCPLSASIGFIRLADVCAGMRLAGASCVSAANEQANAMQEKEEITREADAAVQNTDEENLVEYEIIKSGYGK